MAPIIESNRTQLHELCSRCGVLRLEIFGSAVSSRFDSATSDLDFLVYFLDDTLQGAADRYLGLLSGLERLFGRPIDLVDAEAIDNPYFRQTVDSTRTLIYEARSKEVPL